MLDAVQLPAASRRNPGAAGQALGPWPWVCPVTKDSRRDSSGSLDQGAYCTCVCVRCVCCRSGGRRGRCGAGAGRPGPRAKAPSPGSLENGGERAPCDRAPSAVSGPPRPGSPPPRLQRVGLGQPRPHLQLGHCLPRPMDPLLFPGRVCTPTPRPYLPQAFSLPPFALLGTRYHPASAPAAAVRCTV